MMPRGTRPLPLRRRSSPPLPTARAPIRLPRFASPKLTNEELYLLQKFVRAGLKTNNIGSFSNLVNGAGQDALDSMFGLTVSTATMDDLEKADVIMVINADPSEDNLIAELKIKAALKRGTKVVTVTSSEIPLVKFSDLWIDCEARHQYGPHQRHLQGYPRKRLGRYLLHQKENRRV